MKGTFERTVAIGAAILAAFLIGNAFVSYRNVQHLRSDSLWLTHTRDVIESTEKLLGSVRAIESGQRGYVLTGNRKFLDPVQEGMNRYGPQLEHLRALTLDNPEQTLRVQKLESVVETRLNETRRCIEFVERGDLPSARQTVESGVGDRIMNEIRQLVLEIEREEEGLLDARKRAAKNAYERAAATVFFSAAVGLAAVAVFSLLLYRNMASRAKAAEQILVQRELFRATLAGIGDAVIVTDLTGTINFMNAVGEKLTGWTAEEARGRPVSDVFIAADEKSLALVESPIQRALREGPSHGRVDLLLTSRNGTKLVIDESANRIVDGLGKPTGAVIVFRDITSNRTSEAELIKLAANLSEADRRKDEFLATLAHELRNPLAPIRNGLEILKLSGVNAAVESVCEVMNRQLNHLVRLVDDLMDVSRITRNKLQLRLDRIDLASVIQSAVESCQPLIEANGLTLAIALPDEPVQLNADSTRLAQVFLNLLNNAAKYTESGGRIELTVRHIDDEVVVSVRDTGIGIPPAMLGRVFDLFAQIDSSLERAQGGLGIGLMLVKRLVEMHGGSVEAHSGGRGEGSEFIVRLPVLSRRMLENSASTTFRRPPTGTGRHRVLVVDDNRDSAESLCKLLELMGNEIHVAHDGVEAVEAAERINPDIILLDIGLPRMNGYEVSRHIRRQPGGDRILIIAQTGWGQDEDRRRSRESGIDHHLVKPIDSFALQKLLTASSSVD